MMPPPEVPTAEGVPSRYTAKPSINKDNMYPR
jgi:hypothetical protein